MTGLRTSVLAIASLTLLTTTPGFSQTNYFSHATIRIPDVRVPGPWVQVIETREEWEAFYAQHGGSALNAPPIDFGVYRVVAGGMGEIPSGAPRLAIEEVYELSNMILVAGLAVYTSGPGCGETADVKWPTTAIVIPQSDLPVRVSMTHANHYCE